MPGSWQISGARHPTNSAKVREVLQEPVKICVLSHGLHRTVNIRFKKTRDREREAKEREAGSKRKTGLRQIGSLGNRRSKTNEEGQRHSLDKGQWGSSLATSECMIKAFC